MNELLFGYNTNGFAHHRLLDAVLILADLGYRSVALTLDYYALNPFDPAERTPHSLQQWRERFERSKLSGVVETGARFLLDHQHKHQPTLVSPDGAEHLRIDFVQRAIGVTAALGWTTVSLWSGTPVDSATPEQLMNRLVERCKLLCDHAARVGCRLAFEPEPGMFIDTMAKFEELFTKVNHPAFGLTVDIGHLHCQGETPIEDHLRRWKDVLWNVHIEDMRRGVHDHLMFGEGEIDFPPILSTLREIGYAGGVHVELGRHSYDAVETARKALAFLQGCLK